MNKKIGYVLIVSTILGLYNTVFTLGVKAEDTQVYLTSDQISKVEEYRNDVVEQFKTLISQSPSTDTVVELSDAIQSQSNSEGALILNDVVDGSAQSTSIQDINVPDQTFTLDSDKSLVFSNGLVFYDQISQTNSGPSWSPLSNKLDLNYSLPTLNATTKYKDVLNTRTIYSHVGERLFTVKMAISVYYNGQKAWYRGGFDSAYFFPWITIWNVSDWNRWRESVGTSYSANVAGNFSIKFTTPIVTFNIQSLYLRGNITVNKNGVVTRAWNQ
jgi:hypothetical protein